MDKVLVIGATGQLGRAAIRKLKTRGASLRALVRSPDSRRPLPKPGHRACPRRSDRSRQPHARLRRHHYSYRHRKRRHSHPPHRYLRGRRARWLSQPHSSRHRRPGPAIRIHLGPTFEARTPFAFTSVQARNRTGSDRQRTRPRHLASRRLHGHCLHHDGKRHPPARLRERHRSPARSVSPTATSPASKTASSRSTWR